MNLNKNPTAEELRDLLRGCDDAAGHHLVWVKKNGEVVISRLPRDHPPNGFERDHPEMQLACEPFLAGNEYVGPDAADDNEWVTELFDRLRMEWRKANGRQEVAYIDQF